MAKINFGNTYDSARRDTHIVTSGKSSTEINLGDQFDSSVRNDNVLDLPDDASLQQLSADLISFVQRASVRPDVDQRAVGEVRKAAEAAGAGDEPGTKRYLKAAGKWAIDLAKEISSDLVVSALKSAAGLS